MTTNDLQLGALGFALLMILVAAMLVEGMLTSAHAAATLVPAIAVMAAQVLRHRAAR